MGDQTFEGENQEIEEEEVPITNENARSDGAEGRESGFTERPASPLTMIRMPQFNYQ